jgi:MarR family transcriptional regulator for hemolysin
MPVIVQRPTPVATDSGDCPECLMGDLNWLLGQAHYALWAELAAAFEPLGLTPRGHSVLATAMNGSFTQKHLAELVGLDKTTMVAALDDLERAGFARRVPSPTDRRAHVIEVTPLGRRRVTAANRIAKRVQDEVLRALGGDGERFVATLGRLVRDRLSEPVACKGLRRREPR